MQHELLLRRPQRSVPAQPLTWQRREQQQHRAPFPTAYRRFLRPQQACA